MDEFSKLYTRHEEWRAGLFQKGNRQRYPVLGALLCLEVILGVVSAILHVWGLLIPISFMAGNFSLELQPFDRLSPHRSGSGSGLDVMAGLSVTCFAVGLLIYTHGERRVFLSVVPLAVYWLWLIRKIRQRAYKL